MDVLSGFMGSFMTMLMEPIRVALEESVRRLTVKIKWSEPGRPEQSFELVNFLTDPSKLDMALQTPTAGNANATGTSGTAGTSTSGKTGTGTLPSSSSGQKTVTK
jgi:hypothetical protein